MLSSIQKQVDFYKVINKSRFWITENSSRPNFDVKRLFQSEHENLRREVESVVAENQRLGLLASNSLAQKYPETEFSKQNSDDIILNLKHQIEILSAEKSSIEGLWKTSQKTISNLEIALRHYHKHFNESHPSIQDVNTLL